MSIVRFMVCLVMLVATVSCAPTRGGPAGANGDDWRALANSGQYVKALGALDAGRQRIVDSFKAELSAVFPEALLGLEAEAHYDNTSTIQIALLQTYTRDETSIRVDLVVPTVEMGRRVAMGAQMQQVIRDAIAAERKPAVPDNQYLFVHEYPAMLRQDGQFFKRPQMLIHLGFGAQVVVHSITDVEVETFRAFAEQLPLRELDKVMSK